MKKKLLVFIVSFSLLSCSISEQIIFNSDGSGKLAYTIDMSKMLELTKDLDKNSTKKMSKDLLDDTDKDMDSIISFKDMAALREKEGKEVTPEQLANFEKMKDFSMRIVMNKSKNEAKYIIYSDFKNINNIANVGSLFSAVKEASGKNTEMLGNNASSGNEEVKFSLDGKKFTRTVIEKPYVEEEVIEEYDYETVDTLPVTVDTTEVTYDEEYVDDFEDAEVVEDVNEEDTDNVEMSEEEMKKMNEEFKKMGEMMEKGLKESAYEFQYTFPKKIKKVSIPKSNYTLSDDKKTIFIKYQLEEFTKKIKNLNLDIEFEK